MNHGHVMQQIEPDRRKTWAVKVKV